MDFILFFVKTLTRKIDKHIISQKGECMTLDEWLDKHNIKRQHFAERLGMSIVTLWKVRNGKPCNKLTAQKISFATGGQINPKIRGKNG